MTAVRSDPGLVADVASLGPATPRYFPAGSLPAAAFTGHGILTGFSAENSGSSDFSIEVEGSVTGPGALATITSIAVPAGTFAIEWTVGYGAGAVAAAEQNNMRLTGLAGGNLTAIIPAVANTTVPQPGLTVTGPATLTVQSIGAGTATAVYEAQIVMTPLLAGYMRLYDGNQAPTIQVAVSSLAENASETEYLGDSGVELERGLWVTATSTSIAVTVWFVILQDE